QAIEESTLPSSIELERVVISNDPSELVVAMTTDWSPNPLIFFPTDTAPTKVLILPSPIWSPEDDFHTEEEENL
ncbi:unnamed protein product, partial [Ilex paraguariensis]